MAAMIKLQLTSPHFSDALLRLIGDKPQKTMAFYQQHRGFFGENLEHDLLSAWREEDPRSLADYLQTHRPQRLSSWLQTVDFIEQLTRIDPLYTQNWINKMGRANPVEALKWLETYRGSQGFDIAQMDIYNHWVDLAPKQAIEGVLARPMGRFGHPINIMLTHWYQNDPQASIQWTLALTPSMQRNSYISALAKALSKTDLERAIALAKQNPDNQTD
jgi:hypothetical protein